MTTFSVLIVDDDTQHRDISATILRHHGYTIIEAADGERAVQLALEQRPSVILMDVRLPILNGWAATERLKRDPRTAGIPIIIFTAHALEEDRLESASSGADSYLAKPCEPLRILAEVRHWSGGVERSAAGRSSTDG